MLRLLSGRAHDVVTAVVFLTPQGMSSAVASTRVMFRPLADAEIDHYVETGEGDDKAGAYGIQGRAASFVERIEGSYSGIMGLPLYETTVLLAKFGIAVP